MLFDEEKKKESRMGTLIFKRAKKKDVKKEHFIYDVRNIYSVIFVAVIRNLSTSIFFFYAVIEFCIKKTCEYIDNVLRLYFPS